MKKVLNSIIGVFAALLLVIAGEASAAPAKMRIFVDMPSQTMLVDRGEKHYAFPVSTGKTGYDTPIGAYQPTWLSEHHRSRTYDNAPMPFAVFFDNDGHAIHATGEVAKLGQPASHGCVRLSMENAQKIFGWVQEMGKENVEIIIQ